MRVSRRKGGRKGGQAAAAGRAPGRPLKWDKGEVLTNKETYPQIFKNDTKVNIIQVINYCQYLVRKNVNC